jgi:hypothetical protein
MRDATVYEKCIPVRLLYGKCMRWEMLHEKYTPGRIIREKSFLGDYSMRSVI